MNKAGRTFLEEARSIIVECSHLESPARAAHVAVFAMLVMLDGSGEHIGQQYKLLTEDGELVEFFHHDLEAGQHSRKPITCSCVFFARGDSEPFVIVAKGCPVHDPASR